MTGTVGIDIPFSQTGQAELSVQSTPTHADYASGQGLDYFWLQFDTDRHPLPPWWSRERDRFLRQYTRTNVVLSGITYSLVSQIKNMTWRLVTEDEQLEPLLPQYYDLFNMSQFGDGFRAFLELFATDSYTQDNGAFVELIGDGERSLHYDEHGNPVLAKGYLPKSKVRGFAHIDAGQMWRTTSREYPYVYTNPWDGRITIMHWSRIVGRSQFRQALERGRGIGLCGASRAFLALDIIQSSNEYIWEKMNGQSPEIALAKGVAIRAIEDALKDGAISADAKGLVRYKGIVFMPADHLPGGGEPGIQIIGLKGVPDGWDREKELTLAMYMIASAYGTDVRDLGWSFGTTGATKADAEIQDTKTSGRGRSDVMMDIEEFLNARILPNGIRFEFDNKDDLEDKRKAEIARIRAETRSIQVLSGELSAHEAREMAAQQGDIDPSFLDEQQSIIESESNPTPEALAPQEQEEEVVKSSGYGRVQEVYRKRLFSIFNRPRVGTIDVGGFIAQASALITEYGQKAYLRGIQDSGVGAVGMGDLSPDELNELNTLIQNQIRHLSSMLMYVTQEGDDRPTRQDVRDRVGLWINKGLDGIYNAGLLAGNANGKLEWVYGDTEHCVDCLNLNGRVYRAKAWKAYGLVPRADDLACKGYQCKCELKTTDKPLTRGRPPRLSGAKPKRGLVS